MSLGKCESVAGATSSTWQTGSIGKPEKTLGNNEFSSPAKMEIVDFIGVHGSDIKNLQHSIGSSRAHGLYRSSCPPLPTSISDLRDGPGRPMGRVRSAKSPMFTGLGTMVRLQHRTPPPLRSNLPASISRPPYSCGQRRPPPSPFPCAPWSRCPRSVVRWPTGCASHRAQNLRSSVLDCPRSPCNNLRSLIHLIIKTI
jgi:hypothetical protein